MDPSILVAIIAGTAAITVATIPGWLSYIAARRTRNDAREAAAALVREAMALKVAQDAAAERIRKDLELANEKAAKEAADARESSRQAAALAVQTIELIKAQLGSIEIKVDGNMEKVVRIVEESARRTGMVIGAEAEQAKQMRATEITAATQAGADAEQARRAPSA